MKIMFTGGGTAGHIFPIIGIVREIKKIYPHPDLKIFYVGPKDKFASALLLQEGVEIKTIFAGKMRRYFSIQNFLDVLRLPIGVLQAFFHIFIISPDFIFSKGGYGSLPAVISGWILQVPIFLHESDVMPGLSNKIAGKIALEIFTAFPVEKTGYFPKSKMIWVGNPVRKELFSGYRAEAKKLFSLKGGKPLILVLGGSQGASKINDILLIVLPEILEMFEVVHQTGKDNFNQVKAESEVVIQKELLEYYHPLPFINEKELAHAYTAADIIISRAGSGSILEIASAAKPSLLIPLKNSAQNQQVKNAYAFAENGATLVIEEANLTPNFFLERLKYLFSKPRDLEEMGKRAKEFAKPEAARIVAEYIVTYLTQQVFFKSEQ